jgi:regulator of protease activity HflC (stomatin/prohibitin superfamily)
MMLTFLGFILLALSTVKVSSGLGVSFLPYIQKLKWLGLALVIIGLLGNCIVQINAGEVGVVRLFGKIQKTQLNEGLNFVNPFSKVIILDTKTQNYTMSAVHDEGDKTGDDAIKILTKDGLELSLDLSVLFRLEANKTPNLIRTVGQDYMYKIVRSITRTRMRDYGVYFDAVELYSTKRDQFQRLVFKAIHDDFAKRGLILENVLVRNISLPTTVKESIERKIQAEQESQKMQFVLSKEKQEAERKRVEAQGIADYQRIISEGLTDKQLKYEQIKSMQALSQSENSKVIVMPSNGGQVLIDGR